MTHSRRCRRQVDPAALCRGFRAARMKTRAGSKLSWVQRDHQARAAMREPSCSSRHLPAWAGTPRSRKSRTRSSRPAAASAVVRTPRTGGSARRRRSALSGSCCGHSLDKSALTARSGEHGRPRTLYRSFPDPSCSRVGQAPRTAAHDVLRFLGRRPAARWRFFRIIARAPGPCAAWQDIRRWLTL
jgi:hypothetical protein